MTCWCPRGRGSPRRGGGERGFTLIEVLAALVIVGVAAVWVVGGLTEVLRAQRAARRHVEAVALADARLNELAALPSDSLLAASTAGRFAPPFAAYRWRTETRPVTGLPAVLEATVVVDWDGGSYSLATAVYRDDALGSAFRSAR